MKEDEGLKIRKKSIKNNENLRNKQEKTMPTRQTCVLHICIVMKFICVGTRAFMCVCKEAGWDLNDEQDG